MGRMCRGRGLLIVAALGSLTLAAGAARGQAVIFVDASAKRTGTGSSWADAYPSIQSALSAARSGQQIWVAVGRYSQAITLKSGVGLYGGFAGVEDSATFDLADRDFATNETILDGNRAHRVVTAPSGATVSTRIDGFTITNGSASSGGGLYLYYSSPTIANNTITGNVAGYGGGLYLANSSPTITNNLISGNTAVPFTGGQLGAIGGGLYLAGGSPTMTNNTIIGNSAAGAGGGLFLYHSSPTLANTIVAFNSSGIQRTGGGTPLLRHNCFYGNSSYNYSGIADPTGTDGNISAPPRFVQDPDRGPDGIWGTADDAVGDPHLRCTSPVIDAGTNNVVGAGAVDLAGHPRILGGRADVGAYESGIGDFNGDRRVNEEDAASWAGCVTGPAGGPYGVGCEAFDSEGDGDVDLDDFAELQGVFRQSSWGDYDGDGDVNIDDYRAMAACLFGPAVPPNPAAPMAEASCLSVFDFEADGDVDLRDFAELQRMLGRLQGP